MRCFFKLFAILIIYGQVNSIRKTAKYVCIINIYEGPEKVLSLGPDYFSATFYQTYFITNLRSITPLLKHIFVTFLPSREKQINSLLLVYVGDTDK